jgi:L-threonylcarbamoyladenylate synthase
LVADPPENVGENDAYIGLSAPVLNFRQQVLCHDLEEYAHQLFAFFRAADEAGVSTIYCQTVPESGVGAALMDRLHRAALR